MHEVRRILTPVDLSPRSSEILEYAVGAAEVFGASIEVLHVWDPPLLFAPETLLVLPVEGDRSIDQLAREQAAKSVERLLEYFRAKSKVPLEGRLELGAASEVIVRIASEESFDMIVMGTHGRTGLSHLVLGSVAERVVRHSPCPVLTVRIAGDESADIVAASAPDEAEASPRAGATPRTGRGHSGR